MNKKIEKMIIVSNIRKKKDILFGKLSDKLTLEMKLIEWKNIEVSAKTFGLVGPEKDWRYVRDVLWQNLKRTTLLKCDNMKKRFCSLKTREHPNNKLGDIDKIILDIIGKEPPPIKTENSPKEILKLNRLSPSPSELLVNNNDDSITFFPEVINEDNVSVTSNSNNNNNRTKRKSKTSESENEFDELIELKKKRLNLEIYNLKLDALQKERQLNLPRSEFTKDVQEKNCGCCKRRN